MTPRPLPEPADLAQRPLFSQRIHRARVAKGLTQDELASLLKKKDRTPVNRWENGTQPGRKSAELLALHLGGAPGDYRKRADDLTLEGLSVEVDRLRERVEKLETFNPEAAQRAEDALELARSAQAQAEGHELEAPESQRPQ